MNSNADCYRDEPSFVWCVLYRCLVKHAVDEAVQLISVMYEHELNLSDNIEKLLLKLWESRTFEWALELAKIALEKKLLDIDKHVFLVSILVKLKKITVDDAIGYLDFGPCAKYQSQDERVKNTLDIAWMVREDLEDGFMLPSDDSMLEQALERVNARFSREKK